MVKRWIVKNSSKKRSILRKEPTQDTSQGNVLRLLKNGDVVHGEYMHVCRASREVGYVKVRHVEQQCGSSWRVRNADGAGTTLLRRQPHDFHDGTNVAGYAMEGEVVIGEFLFVTFKGEKRGGYIKRRHLRDAEREKSPAAALPASSAQRWAVMDPGHDGAWMRRRPLPDSSKANVVCLVPNGEHVAGEFMLVAASSGCTGFVRFDELRAEGKAWRVRSSAGLPSTALRRRPLEAQDAENVVGHVEEGQLVRGEHVYVQWRKRGGYVKRRYLMALAQPLGRSAPKEPLLVS